MKHYELLSILPGTLTEEEAQELAAQIKETITTNGGQNLTMEYNGKSRLSYPMRHIRYGYFFLTRFEASPEDAPTIQSKLRLLTQVLRNLCKTINPEEMVELSLGDAPSTQAAEEPKNSDQEEVTQPAPQKTEAKEASEPEKTEEPEASKEEPQAEETKDTSKENISMEEIDQKLDELLEKDM